MRRDKTKRFSLIRQIEVNMKRTKFFTEIILISAVLVLLFSNWPGSNAQREAERVLITKGSGKIVGTNKRWIFIPFDLRRYQSGHYNLIVKLAPGTGISRTGDVCGANFTWAEEGKFPNQILTPKILPLPAGQGYNLGGDFDKPTKFVMALQASCDFDPKLTNEYTYEVYLERGKPLSSASRKTINDAPCDDNEIQTNYDRRFSKYHHYGPLETQICLTNNPQCNRQSAFSTMISQVRFITPTEDSSQVKNCMEVDVDLPGPWGKDTVRVSVNAANYSVTNYTRKDHLLHPGRVTRTIVEKNGAIYVTTQGEGTGDQKLLNKWFSRPIWVPVDNRLREALQQRPPKR